MENIKNIESLKQKLFEIIRSFILKNEQLYKHKLRYANSTKQFVAE